LETSEIAKFIHGFNTAAVSVSVILAVYAVLLILGKALKWKASGKRLFFKAFCVASLVALALEATVFNYPFYLKYFAGPEVQTLDISPDNPNILRTTDGTVVEMQLEADTSSFNIVFKGLDRKITSVYTEVEYSDANLVTMAIRWKDEGDIVKLTKRLPKGLPHENYTVIQPKGKVSELTIMLLGTGNADAYVDIGTIALNKQIPFYFSGLRLLAVSFLFLAVFSFFNKKLRAGMSYYLFENKFNPASWKQNIAYVFTVVSLILFSWVCIYTTVYSLAQRSHVHDQLYNKYLVDAIIEGRTYITFPGATPERLLDAERPYDNEYRIANYELNKDWVWDWAWYKGKFYCYFGVVPAVILYVPYTIITGNYLSNHAGIFIFAAVAIVLLALLWRHCVQKYMPDSRFAFYLLSFLALFFASGLFCVLSFSRFYSIVQIAAYMFAIAGTLLLLKSVDSEKIDRLKLFFACLCFALIAGCRPNMIFASLLVPLVLWKHRSWKLLLFVSIPFIMVAIPLMMYNYIRFESVFEFGGQYSLTGGNQTVKGLLNPIGNAIKTLTCGAGYLFGPANFSMAFPYIGTIVPRTDNIILGISQGGAEFRLGMINFPIVFCLFYLFKNAVGQNKPKTFHIISTFLIIGIVILAVISTVMGFFSVRYIMDFATFIILPSLFCAYYWSDDKKSALPYKMRLKIIYILLAASIFVGLFLFVNGGISFTDILNIRNPVLFRYLESSLGVIRAF
jgi:hypothetical protein